MDYRKEVQIAIGFPEPRALSMRDVPLAACLSSGGHHVSENYGCL